MGSSYKLDEDAFSRRLKRLYDMWKEPDGECEGGFKNMDALIVPVGNIEKLYYKTAALQLWLFGFDIWRGVIVFSENEVHFLASNKKLEVLSQIDVIEREEGMPTFKFHPRDKSDEDKANFQTLMNIVKGSKEGKVVGVLKYDLDNCNDNFVKSFKNAMKRENFQIFDATKALAYCMGQKDDQELSAIRKAVQVSVALYHRYLKVQIEDIIRTEKKVKHSELSEKTEEAINDKQFTSDCDKNYLDMSYSPIIQSGGSYALKFSAESDEKCLHFGAILCSLGVKYRHYCSNITRTLLVKPSDEIKELYKIVVDLQEEVLKHLVPEAKLSDVYKAGVKFIKERKPDMLDKFTKTWGFSIGLEFRDSSLIIGPKSTGYAKKNMVFNVNMGIQDIKNPKGSDKTDKTYAIFVGDTVVVNETGPATVLFSDVELFGKQEAKSTGQPTNIFMGPGAVLNIIREVPPPKPKKECSHGNVGTFKCQPYRDQNFAKNMREALLADAAEELNGQADERTCRQHLHRTFLDRNPGRPAQDRYHLPKSIEEKENLCRVCLITYANFFQVSTEEIRLEKFH